MKRAKNRAFSRLCDTSMPLQNRGSRVRVLPPLPITEVERLRFSFFLCFSVQKRFSIYFFNRFLNQHESTIVPFRTLCDTISVQYSIKKVSRASKKYQYFKAIASIMQPPFGYTHHTWCFLFYFFTLIQHPSAPIPSSGGVNTPFSIRHSTTASIMGILARLFANLHSPRR